MRQIGILCPCLLILISAASAVSQEIVEYSMYDEFGDIMFNAPGRLVKNGRSGTRQLELDEDFIPGKDFSAYRYRYRTDDNYGSANTKERESLTTYRKNPYKTNQVWKFRPLDEKKAQKIIKIEDEPVVPFQPYRYYQPQFRMMPGLFPPILPY